MALKLTNYDIDKEVLGKGAFGTVYSGTKKDIGQKVALKEIPQEICKDKETRANIENEIFICSTLESTNIVKMLDIVDEGEKKYIAYELCNGGDLRKFMKFFERFNEGLIQRIMLQMINGLEELHRKKVIHHDIKPENILIQIFYNEKILSPQSEEKIKKIKELIKKKPNPKIHNNNQNHYNNFNKNNINFIQPNFYNNMMNNNYYMNNPQIPYCQIPNSFYPNNINNVTSLNNIQNNNIINPNPYFRAYNNNYKDVKCRSYTPYYSNNQNNNLNMNYYQNNYYNYNNMNNYNMILRNDIHNSYMNNKNNINNVNNINLNNMNMNKYTNNMINNNIYVNNNNYNMNNMNNNNNNDMNNVYSNNSNNNGNNNINNNVNKNANNNNKKDDINNLNPKNDDDITNEKLLEILKEETEYKLSDFGLSKITNEIYKRNLSGSPLYMSPELFNPNSKLTAIENYKVDIWALGVLAFELFFGRRPFEAFSIEELSNMYKKGDYYIKLNGKISKEFFCFLNMCLQRDPNKRADINKLQNSDFIIHDEETFNMMDEKELLESLGKLGKVDNNKNIILKTYEIYFEDEC